MGIMKRIKTFFNRQVQVIKKIETKFDWQELWDTCVVTKTVAAQAIEAKIIRNKEKYLSVEIKTTVPWDLVAALHYRESSLNFNTCLHNGDPLHKKTTHVPKGRGPFHTWEAAAVDALLMKSEIFPKVWTDASKLEFAQRFNGLGYAYKGLRTPYVWGGTNHQQAGKYVADGKFDANVWDSQLGVAAVLKTLA